MLVTNKLTFVQCTQFAIYVNSTVEIEETLGRKFAWESLLWVGNREVSIFGENVGSEKVMGVNHMNQSSGAS